jgi:hypothetical protein
MKVPTLEESPTLRVENLIAFHNPGHSRFEVYSGAQWIHEF